MDRDDDGQVPRATGNHESGQVRKKAALSETSMRGAGRAGLELATIETIVCLYREWGAVYI